MRTFCSVHLPKVRFRGHCGSAGAFKGHPQNPNESENNGNQLRAWGVKFERTRIWTSFLSNVAQRTGLDDMNEFGTNREYIPVYSTINLLFEILDINISELSSKTRYGTFCSDYFSNGWEDVDISQVEAVKRTFRLHFLAFGPPICVITWKRSRLSCQNKQEIPSSEDLFLVEP